ncbi:hypothetical protein SGFS_103030 [Streptomyces graminofaciens]|uniref:Uncharacterized protein n=1 Tax=Streptomyces graminofaciens TaxID=68212 RepID=A0ABN5W008_9ACTN|nr:hypothetical protein SGFS_103030 [Streptomyces graminofaciens]
MALDAVHEDVEAALGRQVHQPDELVHGRRPDQSAVGLEQGPEVEDPDVVQAQPGDLRQILTREPGIEVVPGVEPAPAWGVVDPEAECGRGRGRRADGVLLKRWTLSPANVSTTMDGDE